MSDNIPIELQLEIIKRVVPVKSLLQFRSVSKQWKSLIHSPAAFIADHSVNQTQPLHLLLRYTEHSELKYVSIVDDDSFPKHKFFPTVPPTAKLLKYNPKKHLIIPLTDCCACAVLLMISRSILLFFGTHQLGNLLKLYFLIHLLMLLVLGFVLKLWTLRLSTLRVKLTRMFVYTLSSGAWRHVSLNLRVPGTGLSFRSYHEVVDGIIYWVTCDKLISFNLTSEEFEVIELQDSLVHPRFISIAKLKESLVVFNYHKSAFVCDVWMMTKNGDPKSLLTKLFTVSFNAFYDSIYHRIVGFRKNDQPIIEHGRRSYGFRLTTLEVYEPCVEHSNDIRTDLCFTINDDFLFMTTFHTESLLLLNHPGSIIH